VIQPDFLKAEEVETSCRLRFFALASMSASIKRTESRLRRIRTFNASNASPSAFAAGFGEIDFRFVRTAVSNIAQP
jgi:hypothetical protein